MMGSLFFSCLLLIGLVAFEVNADSELVFVQAIWRHGSRAPVVLHPRNPNTEKCWPYGLGQLTDRGMDQVVELGEALRQLYIAQKPTFLSPYPVSGEYRFQSTQVDRTMASAAGVASGLWPKKDNKPATTYFVPIFANNLTVDEDLNVFIQCKRSHQFLDYSFEQLGEVENEHTWIFDLIEAKTGKRYTLKTIYEVLDNHFCDTYNKLQPAKWLTPKVLKTMDCLVKLQLDALLGLLFKDEKYRQFARLRGGRLWKTILNRFIERVECDRLSKKNCAKIQKLKFFGYSVHDMTIAYLMTTLTRDFNSIVPGYMVNYTACFTFELWKINGTFAIRILYRNGEGAQFEPITSRISGLESNFWDFDSFVSKLTPYIPDDFVTECLVDNLHYRRKRDNRPYLALNELRFPGWDVALKTRNLDVDYMGPSFV